MPGSSNSSFIPKRGSAKPKRKQSPRHVYVFTLISYVLFFGTLLAAGGMYFYSDYIEEQLNAEVAALNSEISSFSEVQMQRVLEFDLRLQQASGRLNNSASILSLLQALERATINTVQLERVSLERVEDESYSLTASVQTDSFDSTIFQRDTLIGNEEFFSSVEVESVQTVTVNDSLQGENPSLRSLVTFTTLVDVPLSAIPYQADRNRVLAPPAQTVVVDPATEQSLNGDDDFGADDEQPGVGEVSSEDDNQTEL